MWLYWCLLSTIIYTNSCIKIDAEIDKKIINNNIGKGKAKK